MLAVSGVIGTWAGPAEPGTAYVMLHHSIGDLGDGQVGQWGFPRGRHGRVATPIAVGESFGAEIRTGSPVTKILVARTGAQGCRARVRRGDSRRHGVSLQRIRRSRSSTNSTGRAPGRLRHRHREMEDRSGVVKINLALAELPDFTRPPGPIRSHPRGTIALAHSVDTLEQRVSGRARGRAAPPRPFVEACIPTYFDSRLAPEGMHVMSMFTQWVPHDLGDGAAPDELEAYADRVIDGKRAGAQPQGLVSHRQVIGPYDMEQELRPDRRQHLSRRAVGRPALPHAAGARLCRLPDADAGACITGRRRPTPAAG